MPTAVEALVREVLGHPDRLSTEEGEQARALVRRYMQPIVLTPDANQGRLAGLRWLRFRGLAAHRAAETTQFKQ
jgi:hypothetical protein